MLFLVAMVSPSWASYTGATPSTSPGSFDCGQCHNEGSFLDLAPEDLRPFIEIGIAGEQPIAAGETRRLEVVIRSTAEGANRVLGVAIAVASQDPAAASFALPPSLSSADERVYDILAGQYFTHVAPIPFAGGPVTLSMDFTPQQQGNQFIYVVANDANGNGQAGSGDYVWPQRFCLQVGMSDGATGIACDQPLNVLAEPMHPADTAGGASTATGDTGQTGAMASADFDEGANGCGCASGPSPFGWALPMWVLFVARHRRGSRSILRLER